MLSQQNSEEYQNILQYEIVAKLIYAQNFE